MEGNKIQQQHDEIFINYSKKTENTIINTHLGHPVMTPTLPFNSIHFELYHC